MCISDEEAVGDSPSLLHTARGGQGGRTEGNKLTVLVSGQLVVVYGCVMVKL